MAAMHTGRQRTTSIYPELEKFIETRGLTLDEFGALIGFTSGSGAGKMLRGDTEPSRNMIQKICAATGLICIITEDGVDFVHAVDIPAYGNGAVVDAVAKTETVSSSDQNGKEEAEKAANAVVDIVRETADAIMAEVLKANEAVLETVHREGYSFYEFAHDVANGPTVSKQYAYFTLASAVGKLNDIYRKEYLGAGSVSIIEVGDQVGAILWVIAKICESYNLDISSVAYNISKDIDGMLKSLEGVS